MRRPTHTARNRLAGKLLLTPALLLLLCSHCPQAAAQSTEPGPQPRHSRLASLLKKADSLLTRRYRNISTDTLYIVRPQTKWVIKTRGNLSGASFYMKGSTQGKAYDTFLNTDVKGTLNLSLGYAGLSLGVSANPASWAGRYKDYEFNLNSYSNLWGIDLIYHNQQSAGGWIQREGQEQVDIPGGTVRSKTANINAYLAFNHRRFSFPAAFSQSYIQRRSAGSWLMGLSLMWQRLESDGPPGNGIPVSKLNSINIALGAGYGYNFALKHRWLLHLSALPTLVVWNRNRLWDGHKWKAEQMHVPDVIMTGRMALVKNYRHNFMGASLIFNFSAIGEASRLQVHTVKWRARLFYGWRL